MGKEAFDKGKGGVFTVTVAESISFCERILSVPQTGPQPKPDGDHDPGCL